MPLAPTFQPVTWMLTCTILVLLMKAGFTCFETGMVRAKNRINVAIKGLLTRVPSLPSPDPSANRPAINIQTLKELEEIGSQAFLFRNSSRMASNASPKSSRRWTPTT